MAGTGTGTDDDDDGELRHERYVEAPGDIDFIPPDTPSSHRFTLVFLAGGISGCGNWQRAMARAVLARTRDLIVLNPRRARFDLSDESVARAQIEWEHRMLRQASAVSFWFTNETVQPITLYELGAWSMTQKPLFVGIQPGYAREHDVRIQTGLARPDVVVVDALDALTDQVVAWAEPGR